LNQSITQQCSLAWVGGLMTYRVAHKKTTNYKYAVAGDDSVEWLQCAGITECDKPLHCLIDRAICEHGC